MSVRITNTPAIHFVARASLASNVFDLFFDKNVSELPLSAPESPDVLPDWNIMTTTRNRQIRRSTITIAVFKEYQSFQYQNAPL